MPREVGWVEDSHSRVVGGVDELYSGGCWYDIDGVMRHLRAASSLTNDEIVHDEFGAPNEALMNEVITRAECGEKIMEGAI